jgi:hypothetical protein
VTIKQPAILQASHYLRPIGIQDGGVRAQTHLAMVADEQGKAARAFVKHFPAALHKGLFNEWFGYTLMSCLGLPQPPSALMPAPPWGSQSLSWAFVSFEPTPVSQGTPKAIYNFADNPGEISALINRLLACHATPSTIAADELVLNGDRNMGNLVFTGPKSFVVIDHSDVLGGPTWNLDDLLRPTGWVDNTLLTACQYLQPLPNSAGSAVCASAEVICQTLWENYLALYEALDCQNHWESRIALQAVWWRSLELAKWFKNKLQLLT